MRILKQSLRTSPRLSLILLDWGVRESFHLLHYLKTQTLPRDAFEVILIEYYDGRSQPAAKFDSEIDTWILLEMPATCYYHKHLMYNVGIVLSKGEILAFGDSDAMVKPTFVETIVNAFDRDPLMVYHVDEFRNVRRDFYPFNYPSFEDVLGDGCINNVNGKTKGILDEIDPIHTRNYGACMCAWRKDLIAIGGADEDMTYLGHVCGPYDMTFRLMNSGHRLVWETEEYLYHTWHPGTDGTANYLGPHDGRNVSTTALQALCTGRIPPRVENEAIRRLRVEREQNTGPLNDSQLLIDPAYVDYFNRLRLGGHVNSPAAVAQHPKQLFASYNGCDIYRINGHYYGVPHKLGTVDPNKNDWLAHESVICAQSFSEIRAILDEYNTRFIETVGSHNICAVGSRFTVIPHELGPVDFQLKTDRENSRIVWEDSLREARRTAAHLNQTAEAHPPNHRSPEGSPKTRAERGGHLIESAGSFNICQVGSRFAVVPHELGRIDFETANDNPAILWAETLRGAREVASRLSTPAAEVAGPPRESFWQTVATPGATDWQSTVTKLQWDLAAVERRVGMAELGITAIYQSRIWRALVWAGGVLQGVIRPFR
jgi:hypothetical protein